LAGSRPGSNTAPERLVLACLTGGGSRANSSGSGATGTGALCYGTNCTAPLSTSSSSGRSTAEPASPLPLPLQAPPHYLSQPEGEKEGIF